MSKNNINITFFCGGSGCSSFIKYLSNFKNININLIINGYDYGKSSGKIRDIIPGMLAPSDFRKNISLLMDDQNILKKLIDYRLNNLSDYEELIKIIKYQTGNTYLKNLIINLPYEKYNKFVAYINIFNDHIQDIKKNNETKNFFEDFSIGNILFGGFYLKKRNFNLAIKEFSIFTDIKHSILNITNGENLYLYSLNILGEISNEVGIIENTNLEKINDIFLIDKILSNSEITKIHSLKNVEKIKYLDNLHISPSLNLEVLNTLKESDLIIFGPGTQHSSLFPSYLTKNLQNILIEVKCNKILLTNIYFDNDLFHENALTLIEKFYYYMFDKKNIKNNGLIDFIFLNKFDEDNINLIDTKKYFPSEVLGDKKIKMLDFEGEKGKHLPQLVFDEISKNSRFNFEFLKNQPSYFLVSIIIPCLNEESTISKVINNIINLNFSNLKLDKEIIVVDGGSNDRSIEICKKFSDVKVYSLKDKGRGEVLNYGINKSKGDIIVTFPSDNEYAPEDINKIVTRLYSKDALVVYGSRMIKYKQKKYLKKIYKNNYLLYLTSKTGGLLIRLLILVFYNKYVADPFTSLKGFKSEVIKNIKNECKGVDYDINQIIQLTKKEVYINEIEVSYFARPYEEGKKTNIFEGLRSLLVIFSSLFFKSKNMKKK